MLHWFTDSFIHSFSQSLTHSLTHSLIHSFISFFHSFIHSCIHPSIHSFIHSVSHSVIPFIHSFTDWLNHWFVDSLVKSLSCAPILSCHFIGISTTISSCVDAPHNFNRLWLLHLKNDPIGHWFLVVIFYFRNLRPGACRVLSGIHIYVTRYTYLICLIWWINWLAWHFELVGNENAFAVEAIVVIATALITFTGCCTWKWVGRSR